MLTPLNRPVRLAYKTYFFSQRTVFFSHNKSVNSIFSHGLSAKQTGHVSLGPHKQICRPHHQSNYRGVNECKHLVKCALLVVRSDGLGSKNKDQTVWSTPSSKE